MDAGAEIAKLDANFAKSVSQITINMDQYKNAALKLDLKECERMHEIILAQQSDLLDEIYARCVLMRQAGQLPK